MSKKRRIPIPLDISAEIQFLSDRTCCVCNIRGKATQIHHIDEDPSNNLLENLALLCLECHNDTMIKGGFGRKLEAHQIILYKTDWLSRIVSRKEKADELASIETLTGSTVNNLFLLENNETEFKVNDDPKVLGLYLRKLLVVRDFQLILAHEKWDSGITTEMNEGNSDMIDFYQEILIELATFYPPGHFNRISPEHYFKDYISSRFSWFWLMLEPQGQDTGGRLVSTLAGGMVMSDLEKMIGEMVSSLMEVYQMDYEIQIDEWLRKWDTKSN